jgi:hypothetical protein
VDQGRKYDDPSEHHEYDRRPLRLARWPPTSAICPLLSQKAASQAAATVRFDRNILPRHPPANLHVTFRTVHGSKGLEADYIVIPGMITGTYGFPSTITDDPVLDLAMPAPKPSRTEERRLFYVALIRARRAVVLISHPRGMSPFVIELLKAPHVTVTGNNDAPLRSARDAVTGGWSNETASSARFWAAPPSRPVRTNATYSSGHRASVRPPEDGTDLAGVTSARSGELRSWYHMPGLDDSFW